MKEYWLARSGQKYGPYSLVDIHEMVVGGRAADIDLVWKNGMAGWEPLSRLVPVSASLPPPPPPPSDSFFPGSPVGPGMWTRLEPPSLHWTLVILLSIFTLGIFSWIWAIREASFVRKLDRGSSALLLMVLATLGQVAVNILYVGVLTASNNDDRLGFLFFELTAACLSTVFFYVAVFQMRRTLLRYYNHTQPIGLRLSGAMTFFIQHAHHFSRLAKWQESGYLEPQ